MIRPKSPRGFSLWRRAGLFFGANMGNKESSNGMEGGGECSEHTSGAATLSGMNSVKSGLVKRKDKPKKMKGKQKANSMTLGGSGSDELQTANDPNSGFMMVGSPTVNDMNTSPLQSSGSIKPGTYVLVIKRKSST